MFQFSIKQWLTILLLILVALAGMYLTLKSFIFNPIVKENTTIMLEKIKTVTKLTTIEGQFSEIHEGGETYDMDIFGLFSKKILLRVTAKVSVGYNFENIDMKIDSLARTVTIKNIPKPEILSIDHDLDYYDVSEGTFNSFSPAEFNKINRGAKEKIAQNEAIPRLIEQAEKQKKEYIQMMEIALQSAGWRLIIEKNPNLKF